MGCLGDGTVNLVILKTTNSHTSHTKFKLTNIAMATNVYVDYLPSNTGNEKKLAPGGI